MTMTKEIWMQKHFDEHFHDKVNKQALLELTLGINTILKSQDPPLVHALKQLLPCQRVAITQVHSPSAEQKFSATSRVSNIGYFGKENQEKPSQPENSHTPTPTKKS